MTNYFVLEVKDESAAQFPKKYNWDADTSFGTLQKYIHDHKLFQLSFRT